MNNFRLIPGEVIIFPGEYDVHYKTPDGAEHTDRRALTLHHALAKVNPPCCFKMTYRGNEVMWLAISRKGSKHE